MRSWLFVFAAWWLVLAATADAHPLDVGALNLVAHDRAVQTTLDVSLPFWRKLTGAPDSAPAPDAAALSLATLGSGPLTVDGVACELKPTSVALDGERMRLEAQATCARDGGELRWALPFVGRGSVTFQLLVHVERGGTVLEEVLEPGKEILGVFGEGRQGFGDFILMGIHHIGATPTEWWSEKKALHFPEGIDHIFFLLALLLIDVQFIPVLKTVTGFTVGHSITLSLAALGFVRLPTRFVESAIALTIAYVAADDLYKELRHEKSRPRWQIAVAFGLIHGFGFARALSDLHLGRSRLLSALVGFNLGVEIGQEIVVAVVAPLLWLLYKVPRARRIFAPVFAVGILGASLVWFVQRAFG